MREYLDVVDLRLRRSAVQQRAFDDAIKGWVKGNTGHLRHAYDEGRLGFRILFDRFDVPATPAEWGFMIGECAHNMRSTLDNLAYALSRLQQDPPPRPKAIAFPVCRTSQDFAGRRHAIADIPAAAADLIELCQPFNQKGPPESDPLWLLTELNNQDKHRLPMVMTIDQRGSEYDFGVEFYTEEDRLEVDRLGIPGPTAVSLSLVPGCTLVEYRAPKPIKAMTHKFNIDSVVALQLPRGPERAVDVLAAIGARVADVVDQFRPFF